MAQGVGSDLDRWLAPFLEVLRHKKRRSWAPLYVRGLLGPGERKSGRVAWIGGRGALTPTPF